jgi:hypothetical protein
MRGQNIWDEDIGRDENRGMEDRSILLNLRQIDEVGKGKEGLRIGWEGK